MAFSKIKISRVDVVPSGVPGLDSLMEGGFIRGNIVTVCGDTGVGKTTLATQFLYHGAKEHGEPGLYISFDEHKRSYYRNMIRYGWDFDKLEKEKKFIFIEYPVHEVEQFLAQEGVIRDLIDTVGVERLVIDSATSLELVHETELQRRQGVLKLIGKLRNWGCTTLLVSEGAAEVGSVTRDRFGAEVLSDGLIQLYYLREKGVRTRALEIVKMRGVVHECRLVPMNLTATGIALDLKKHV
ncbi:AAA family ATPase [Candidatus Micrarchaeota archaeon]|nr:AAA family ATPase [Candidatus Micrarchaeota archaeon]